MRWGWGWYFIPMSLFSLHTISV